MIISYLCFDKFRKEEIIKQIFEEKSSKDLTGFENLSGLLSKQFSNLFNAYTKAFNNQQNRKGSLFMSPFKRKLIAVEEYLIKLVHYIHYNPIAAKMITDYGWTFSSYPAFLSQERIKLIREKVMDYFGDMESFLLCHRLPPKISGIESRF